MRLVSGIKPRALLLSALLAGALAAAEPLPDWLAAPRLDSAAIEAHYNEAILRDGTVEPAVKRLTALAADPAHLAASRARALLVASHLEWRFGRLAAALATCERAVALDRSGDTLLMHARLLEAAARLPEARKAYEEAAGLVADPEQLEELRLRLVFLTTDAQNVTALVQLAQSREREFRNRAAVALAILNHPAEATALYEVFGEGSVRQRQQLRVAQWAVQARQAPKAQDAAWEAVLAGALTRDIRYTLSLLVEAHELDGSWDKLLARFAAHPDLGPEAQAVRVGVLRKLRRFDEAIALAESEGREKLTPESQRRLLRMYAEAGRTDAMIAEFRRLMARDPAELTWPRGLSEFYLEQGHREEAAHVWREFTARHDGVDLLLEGAQAMAQLGLDDLALAAAERCLAVAPDSKGRVIWFRFDHFLRRGQSAKAEDSLRTLDAELPPGDPARIEIADAYERLKNPRRALAIWEGLAARPDGLGTEEKMRMAWLYDTTGQRDKALAVWRGLWASEVPEARRKMIEDRLVALAAESGGLGDIAVELEQKLRAGTATPRDRSLLIRIYTDVNDPASAIEVIQEYFARRERTPESEIASLKEQAHVYQALNRHAAFAQVTEKLLQLDPANRTDYLQSLILKAIDGGAKAERDKLPARLAALRQSNASANDEFEAGVLVLANQRGQAIDSYRRALARNPGHNDDYLLLADLLKQDRKLEEGLALLQYFAEIAGGDDAFIIAIDGILNLKPAADSPVLRWAQRRVLERITRRDDKYYLYDLAAELFESARDTKGYLAALENALIDAGPRRSTVLRELISSTEDKTDYGPRDSARIDPRRNLSYSRRLIALGDELPPEVYLNLGRAFLKMAQPDEALEAFNLAIDRTDRASLVEESADRFEAAGYYAQATVLYEKALTHDAESVGVMTKLARVRSRDGDPDLARGLYLRALLKLAGQQLAEVESSTRSTGVILRSGQDQNTSYLYKRYATTLQNGFVFTTPPGAELPPEIESAFDRALDEVVARLGGRPPKPLDNYPRLNVLARLARTAALAAGRYEAADRVDLKLLRNFGTDARLVSELVSQRLAWGRRTSADALRSAPTVPAALKTGFAERTAAPAALPPLLDLAAAARQALTQRNYELAADTALAAGDATLVDSVYQDWIAARRNPAAARSPAAAAAAAAAAAGGTAQVVSLSGGSVIVSSSGGIVRLSGSAAGGPASLAPIVAHARRKLAPERFAALCRQIAGIAAENQDIAREFLFSTTSSTSDLLRGGSGEKSILASLEEAAGRPLLTDEQLAAAVTAVDARRLTMLDLGYVMSRLTPAARADLFLRAVQAMPATSTASIIPVIAALRPLLANPVDPAATPKITAAVKARLDAVAKNPQLLRSLALQLSSSGNAGAPVHPDNRPFLATLDRQIAEAFPEALGGRSFSSLVAPNASGPPTMPAVLEGALQEIAQLDPSYPSSSVPFYVRRYLQQFNETIYPKGKAELLALVEAKAAGAALTPVLFNISLAVLQNDPAGSVREVAAWLERQLQRQPDYRPALEALPTIYRQLGDIDRERAVLERLMAVSPDPEPYRLRLAALWRQLDHPANTLAALGGRPPTPSPDDPNSTITSYYASRTPQFGTFLTQLNEPTSEAAARAAVRGLFQILVPQNDVYQMQQSGVPALDYSTVLEMSDNRPASSATRAPAAPGRWLQPIEADDPSGSEAGSATRIIDRLATQSFAVPELESLIRALDPTTTENEDLYYFYTVLANAYEQQGRAATECARLTKLAESGGAGQKELLLWAELALRQPKDEAPALATLAEKALLSAGVPVNYQRVQLARLYARAGQHEKALGVYSVAATTLLASTTYRSSRSGDRLPLFSVMGLCLDAEKYLDRAVLATCFARMAQIARPGTGGPQEQAYQRFLLWLGTRALETGVPAASLPAPPATLDPATARREDLARLAHWQSHRVPADQALPALRAALRKVPEVQSAIYISSADMNSGRYAVQLGIQRSPYESSSRGDTVGLPLFKALFPLRTDGAPPREWFTRAAQALPTWIGAPDVDSDLALQVLALVTLRQHQLGLPEATASGGEMLRRLAQLDRVSTPAASLAIAVADQVKVRLDLALLRQLVATRRIEVRQLAGVVRTVADSEGAAAAQALGESALAYTRNDDLLATLISLAERANDEAARTRYQQWRTEATAARAVLEKPKSPGAERVSGAE